MILRQFLHADPVAASYLIGCGGRAAAAVVDPLGDLAPYRKAAEATGMRIRYVIDTHVHADHVSAGRALAEAAGAEYVLFAQAPVNFPFRGVRDGEVLELGNVAIEVLHTPGHTPSTSRSSSPTAPVQTRRGSPSPGTPSWSATSAEPNSPPVLKKARAPCSAACSV